MEISRDYKEIWKDIEGYKGIYEVSSLGRVKSLRRKSVTKDRIINGRKDRDGYIMLHLKCTGKKAKQVAAHRLVAKAFISNPLNKPEVNHKDGDKLNNKLENLEWCTGEENNMHALKTGLIWSKLSKKEVLHIRDIYANKEMKQIEMAGMFNVSKSTISQIVNNKSRNHY